MALAGSNLRHSPTAKFSGTQGDRKIAGLEYRVGYGQVNK